MSLPTTRSTDTPPSTNGTPATTSQPAGRKTGGGRGFSLYVWIAAVLGVILLGGGVYAFLRLGMREPFTGHTYTVKKERLQVTIVERGSLESAQNNDIVVRVKAGTRGSTNASIIKWVLDDGAQVKAGDLLVELDDSGYQDTLKTQSNVLNKAKSDLIQAQTDYDIQSIQNETDIKSADATLTISMLTLSKYGGTRAAKHLQKLNSREELLTYLKEGFDKDVSKEAEESKGKFTSAYLQEVSIIEGTIETTRSDKETWLDRSKWSQRMVKKGLYSPSQAEADESRLQSAEISLRKAVGDLDLYRKFDLEAKITQYWSDVKVKERDLERIQKQADSKLKQKKADEDSKRAIYIQERDRYDDMKKDEKFYKMVSPQDGMVVYYVPEQSRFGSGSQQSIVAQGEPVREGQKLMRIPNLYKMLVNVRVHEAMVSKVHGERIKPTGYSERLRLSFSLARNDLWALAAYQYAFEDFRDHFKDEDQHVVYKGQKAGIRIDAHPGKQYKGRVKSKATVASQADFLSSDVKVYQTMVSIDDMSLEDDLRPGMSAEVTILADEIKEPVVVIPIQSVVGNVAMGAERKCYVVDDQGFPQERMIKVGLSSDKMVQVLDGLQEGEKVVQNPRPLIPEKSDMKAGIPGARRGSEFDDGDGKKGGKKKDGGQRPEGKSLQRPEGVPPSPPPAMKKN